VEAARNEPEDLFLDEGYSKRWSLERADTGNKGLAGLFSGFEGEWNGTAKAAIPYCETVHPKISLFHKSGTGSLALR